MRVRANVSQPSGRDSGDCVIRLAERSLSVCFHGRGSVRCPPGQGPRARAAGRLTGEPPCARAKVRDEMRYSNGCVPDPAVSRLGGANARVCTLPGCKRAVEARARAFGAVFELTRIKRPPAGCSGIGRRGARGGAWTGGTTAGGPAPGDDPRGASRLRRVRVSVGAPTAPSGGGRGAAWTPHSLYSHTASSSLRSAN